MIICHGQHTEEDVDSVISPSAAFFFNPRFMLRLRTAPGICPELQLVLVPSHHLEHN